MWKSAHHFVKLNNLISLKTAGGWVNLFLQYVKVCFYWLSGVIKSIKTQISILICFWNRSQTPLKCKRWAAGHSLAGTVNLHDHVHEKRLQASRGEREGGGGVWYKNNIWGRGEGAGAERKKCRTEAKSGAEASVPSAPTRLSFLCSDTICSQQSSWRETRGSKDATSETELVLLRVQSHIHNQPPEIIHCSDIWRQYKRRVHDWRK